MPEVRRDAGVAETVEDIADRLPEPVGPPADRLKSRLAPAAAISLVLNAALWLAASSFVRNHVIAPPQIIQITRIILPPPVKQPKPKPKRIVKPPPPKPKPLPPPPKPIVQHLPPPKPAPSPPQGAHHRVLIAKGPPTPSSPAVMPGGNAPVGMPTGPENPGNAVVNPPAPTPPQPAPQPAPAPPATTTPGPAPKPAPPPPAPKPVGPTRDAEPENQVNPEIPDDLKQESFQTSVRVRVEIAPDGSFTPSLRSSSGNAEIDGLVLDALKKWKWKPALQDGQPVQSVQLFRFDFEVD